MLREIKVVHLEGENEFPEILAFRRRIEQLYGIEVELLTMDL